jgi:Yip1 domain
MDLDLTTLLQMARETVRRPREGARALMRLNLPMSARWTALMLMAVLSAVFTHLSIAAMPLPDQAGMEGVIATPMRTAALQVVMLVVLVQAVYRLGRWRGGSGSFADAMLLISWLQFILLVLQVVQIALLVLLPPVGELLGLVGLVLFLWLLTNFTAELHGFRSLLLVFLGIIAALVSLAFLLSLLFVTLFGVGA